jgi:hypothetical protein
VSRKKRKKKKLATLPAPCYSETMMMTRDEKEARRERYRLTRGRDYAMMLIIGGATKAGTHTDRRKEKNRKACRKKVDRESGE